MGGCEGSKTQFLPWRSCQGDSLVAQWLGHHTSTAGALGLIPGQGTKILQAAQCSKKKDGLLKKKKCYQSKGTELTQLKQLYAHESLVPRTHRGKSLTLQPPKILDSTLKGEKKFYLNPMDTYVTLFRGHISILSLAYSRLRAKSAGYI